MAYMQPVHSQKFRGSFRRLETTLLDLVWAVSQVTNDDQLVTATVAHLVNSGRARLTGTFKNARLRIE